MALRGGGSHRVNGALRNQYCWSVGTKRRWSVDSTTIYTDFQFSECGFQKDEKKQPEKVKTYNITLPHRKKKKSDVQSEEKPGADWRRLSGLQGQRFVSEEVKVRAKLAYLCKLKLSSRTTDGWFQLKCEHVTEGALDSPNAHSFYGCNSLRTGKDKGTKWEKMKKMAGGSHIAQVISNNKIVTNCCLQRQKKKRKKRQHDDTAFLFRCVLFSPNI